MSIVLVSCMACVGHRSRGRRTSVNRQKRARPLPWATKNLEKVAQIQVDQLISDQQPDYTAERQKWAEGNRRLRAADTLPAIIAKADD